MTNHTETQAHAAADASGANLVLLPGLDGTDVFLRPLVAALPSWVNPIVVTYPDSVASVLYQNLLAQVIDAVADLRLYHVLGWSFSGPLALMLASSRPRNVRSVILAASFVRPPRPWLAKTAFATARTPVVWGLRAARRLPLLVRPPDNAQRQDKVETWTRVSATTVAGRLRAISKVDVRKELRVCAVPLLCLASNRDRVVPKGCVTHIVAERSDAQVATIDGEHQAMYTNPTAAARAITAFISRSRCQPQTCNKFVTFV